MIYLYWKLKLHAIEKEQTDLDSDKKTVEDEIAALEEELDEIKERESKTIKTKKLEKKELVKI